MEPRAAAGEGVGGGGGQQASQSVNQREGREMGGGRKGKGGDSLGAGLGNVGHLWGSLGDEGRERDERLEEGRELGDAERYRQARLSAQRDAVAQLTERRCRTSGCRRAVRREEGGHGEGWSGWRRQVVSQSK